MGTNLMQSKHHLSGLALAAAAAVLATASAAALADRDTPQPKSVTVSFGEWKIDRTGDSPQWTLRGARVFVSQTGTAVPSQGKVLRP